jgi:hypothetical protein
MPRVVEAEIVTEPSEPNAGIQDLPLEAKQPHQVQGAELIDATTRVRLIVIRSARPIFTANSAYG